MSTHAKITGIGYCGMDYLCIVPQVPLDDKVEIIESLVQGGGPSVTAIVAAARLGAKAAFCGAVGDDERGAQIVKGLADEGLDTHGVKVRRGAESPAGFCWIEQKSGKRSIAWTRGNARPLSPREIDRDLIRESSVLHMDGHQAKAAIAAAKIARKQGVTVSIDAGTLVPDIDELLGLSDIVIASEKFAGRYTGEADMAAAVKKLFAGNRRFAAVTLGKAGSLGFDGKRLIKCPAFKVGVVDTTGAGDVYHGAFIFDYARGSAWAECMRFAAAVSALKCTKFGGRTGIPSLTTAERFMRKQ
ncbi:MAG TPA: PfkB family carbohydrate kinase [Kiritimatiellia bacterium]|nr:PfkB family carbohydrate kinase [Kiritimatiellia bacterium]HPS09271.1 PfkB family carbohydrate kinase [Kiritimatiellia bacterium]